MQKIPSLCALPLLVLMLPQPARAQVDESTMLALAAAVYGEACFALLPEAAEMFPEPVRRHELTLPGVDGMEPQALVVWEVLCDGGAYNTSTVYWTEAEFYGLRPLAFAMPVMDIVLERPEDSESPVREVRIVGWTAVDRLVNAQFDAASMTFFHYDKYRGLGDAYEEASWQLVGMGAQLRSIVVDGSYDGEITPVTVYTAP